MGRRVSAERRCACWVSEACDYQEEVGLSPPEIMVRASFMSKALVLLFTECTG